MTERYNPYIKPNYVNYVSEIAFINATPAVVFRELFHVIFDKGGQTGLYLDNNGYLKKIFWEVRKSGNNDVKEYLKRTQDFIKSIQPSISFYSYVKILEDKQNPQLEGQIMIMKYGRKIKDIIQDYFANSNYQSFQNIFKVIVSLESLGFPNYDRCHFTDTEIKIVDQKLDLNSEVQFRTINLISLQRKEKLEQLKNNKERNYEDILNGVPLEEIEKYLEKAKIF